jgi:hypothetical protein
MGGLAKWAFGAQLQVGDGGETPVGGGGSTTLAAAAASGATNIKVTAVTGFAAADLVLIGGTGGQIREILTVGTAGAGGTGIDLTDALDLAVANGATFVEVEPEGFTTIAEVKDISGPDLSADTEDVTAHDSEDGIEESIPTILRTGEVTFPVNFVPGHATHGSSAGGLIHAWRNRVLKNYRLVMAPAIGYTWAFTAYVTGMSFGNPVGGAAAADVTLDVTGAPTLAPSV